MKCRYKLARCARPWLMSALEVVQHHIEVA
jgi:hypothetical protein